MKMAMVRNKKPKNEEKLENTKINKSNSGFLEKNSFHQMLLCIGEYSSKIIMQDTFRNKKGAFSYPLLAGKFSKDVSEWSQSIINQKYILSLEKNVDSHFWYQILPVFSENNDKGLATAESTLVKEVSIGGLERKKDGKLHKTYTGAPPKACPT